MQLGIQSWERRRNRKPSEGGAAVVCVEEGIVHDDAEEVIGVVPKLCFLWYLRIDEDLVVNVVRLGSRTCE
jgi:hypothetical protein